MLKHRSLILVVVWGAVAGCTVVEVKPVDRRQHDMRLVCIEHNQAVKMSGFLPMLEKSFADHGISTLRYDGRPPEQCEYTADYVAHWNWDLAVYMTDAEVHVRRGGEVVGNAVYHLRNKGGLDMSKWASSNSKMQPVMNELLNQFVRSNAAAGAVHPADVPERK